MKILVVLGTRPEVIKLASFVFVARESEDVELVLCTTGQHREMVAQALQLFGIKVDHDLNLMRPNQNLAQLTADVLVGVDAILRQIAPDLVVVQGDTTTAFISSLAAFYRQIPIAHIEAGLRTGERDSPFPEEINRLFTDALSHWYFAPTEQAKENLLRERIPQGRIFVTGNTVTDALQWMKKKMQETGVEEEFSERYRSRYGVVLSENERVVLVTVHRRESFGPELENVCAALVTIAANHPKLQIVFPVHPNPNVQGPVKKILGGIKGIHLLEPLDYIEILWLLSKCHLVLTDSGGIQEEAPSFNKPVLVLRKTTERPEGVAAGVARLVGTSSAQIVAATSELLACDAAYRSMASGTNPYGDGRASERILNALLTHP